MYLYTFHFYCKCRKSLSTCFCSYYIYWHDSINFLTLCLFSVDIISAIEFNKSGSHLATGDRGGRVVLFERTDLKDVSHKIYQLKLLKYKYSMKYQENCSKIFYFVQFIYWIDAIFFIKLQFSWTKCKTDQALLHLILSFV